MPALELDDGTRINDAVGICVYFEAVHPQPALMGESAEQKALIASWQREVERNGFYAVMEAFRNSTPGLKGRALPGPHDYEQIPALAERGRRHHRANRRRFRRPCQDADPRKSFASAALACAGIGAAERQGLAEKRGDERHPRSS